jgi:hypothetical protein
METISPLQGAEYLVRLDRRLSAIEARLIPAIIDVPYVGGDPSVGGTLNCTMGNWTGQPTSYAYQWKSDATADVGTGENTYLVADTDAGHSLSCVVTATNGAGTTAAPPSNAVPVPGAAVAAAPPSAAARAPVHSGVPRR